MNPLGMSDREYDDFLSLSMAGGPDVLDNDGQICRQGLYNWEDAFDGCHLCEGRDPYAMVCTDGYRHRPMYGATEEEITTAWNDLMLRESELLRSIREMRAHDYDSH